MASKLVTLSVDRIPDRETKPCSRCKRAIPLDQYPRCSTRPDGLDIACKQCRRIAMYTHYHEGGGKRAKADYNARDEVRAAKKRWTRDNAAKVKQAKVDYLNSPRGKLIDGRWHATKRLKVAKTEKGRICAQKCIALYDAEIARMDAGNELRLEPPPIPRSSKGRPELIGGRRPGPNPVAAVPGS